MPYCLLFDGSILRVNHIKSRYNALFLVILLHELSIMQTRATSFFSGRIICRLRPFSLYSLVVKTTQMPVQIRGMILL
jgi:hypothetical protein